MQKVEQDSLFKFSHPYRLVSKHDFQSVFAKPCKFVGKNLIILCRPNQKAHGRLGIIIAKRYVKQAVCRNKVRRVVRESFRHHKEALKGLDIVVLMRSEWAPQDKQAGKKVLRESIDKLWQTLISTSNLV